MTRRFFISVALSVIGVVYTSELLDQLDEEEIVGKAESTDYTCHRYTSSELELKNSGYTDKQICEHAQARIFTGGRNLNFPGCGSCWCCEAGAAVSVDYECHHYTPLELQLIHSGAYTDKQICEHNLARVYTQGRNSNFPGCGSCWCCKVGKTESTDYTCHHYTALERELKNSEGHTDKQICEHDPARTFTEGKNANFPGCGSCWCCKVGKAESTDYTCHHYTSSELELKNSGYTDKQICEFAQARIFTEGRNLNFPGCGSCSCCEAGAAVSVDYECHHYTTLELQLIHSEEYTDKQICEHNPARIYTRGRNSNFPGCGRCWCCKALERELKNSEGFTDKQICGHDPARTFTEGKNANYPGCGSCWCCEA